MNMSNLDVTEIKAVLKALLAELVKLVAEENISRRTKTKVEAKINPISIAATEGIERLVEELEKLDVPALIAVIKKYGLDKTRKSYTWKTKDKLVNLIKERVSASSTRGDVFSGNDNTT